MGIRTLQTVGESKVGEGVRPELIGIINYAAMALVQLERGVVDAPDLDASEGAGLVQAASIIRTIEQQLGRQLTAAERALVYESITVVRGISQTIFPATGTIIVPENEAVLRGIFQGAAEPLQRHLLAA